jgi:hypothetical protein
MAVTTTTTTKTTKRIDIFSSLWISRSIYVATLCIGALWILQSQQHLLQQLLEADVGGLVSESLQVSQLLPHHNNRPMMIQDKFGACIMFKDDLHLLRKWMHCLVREQ